MPKKSEDITPSGVIEYQEVTPYKYTTSYYNSMPMDESTILKTVMFTSFEKMPCIRFGESLLHLELDEPSAEIQEIAKSELRETPERKLEAIEQLRDLLKAQTDLKCPYDNDTWLIRFLRPCKFYPESALQLIKNYYEFKIKHANVYDDLKPSKEQNVFNNNLITVLHQRDQHGRRILVIQLGKYWNHKKVCLDEVFKGAVLVMEAAMLEPQTQICGAVVIFDMDGLTLQQTWQFTPPFAKRIVDWLQDAVPLRIKGFHIVNQPYVFNMVFQLFKPFLREKLKSRIHFHGSDRASLHKHISAECLPKLYGGEVSTPWVSGSQWMELLLLLDNEFEAINSYGYPKKSKK